MYENYNIINVLELVRDKKHTEVSRYLVDESLEDAMVFCVNEGYIHSPDTYDKTKILKRFYNGGPYCLIKSARITSKGLNVLNEIERSHHNENNIKKD